MKKIRFFFILAMVVFVAACGSDDKNETKKVSGKVYGAGEIIAGADVNFKDQTLVKTDDAGVFGEIENKDGEIFAKGGKSLTGVQNTVNLSAPQAAIKDGKVYITPLTSLLAKGAKEEDVKKFFELNTAFSTADPASEFAHRRACFQAYTLIKSLGVYSYHARTGDQGSVIEKVAEQIKKYPVTMQWDDVRGLASATTSNDWFVGTFSTAVYNFITAAKSIEGMQSSPESYRNVRLSSLQAQVDHFWGLLVNRAGSEGEIKDKYGKVETILAAVEKAVGGYPLPSLVVKDIGGVVVNPGVSIFKGSILNFDASGSINTAKFDWEVISDQPDYVIAKPTESKTEITFSSLGDCVVRLTVTNNNGATSIDFAVNVKDGAGEELKVTVDGAALEGSVVSGKKVTFDASSVSGTKTWSVDTKPVGSDLTIPASGDKIEVTFVQNGSYRVHLRTSTGRDIYRDITVIDGDGFSANAGADKVIIFTGPGFVTLNGSGSIGETSYSWSLKTGQNGTSFSDAKSPTPTFYFQGRGEYEILLTIKNDKGEEKTDTLIITVQDVTTGGAPAIYNDPLIRVESSWEDANKPGLWHYRIAFKGTVNATGPFVQANSTGGAINSFASVNGGQYILEITRYNGYFWTGGYGHGSGWWADATESTNFYSSASGRLEFVLADGKIYRTSDIKEVLPPNASVDLVDGNMFWAWVENARVEVRTEMKHSLKSHLNPFYALVDENGYSGQVAMEVDEYGFGHISLPLANGSKNLQFSYGGDSTSGDWVDPSGPFVVTVDGAKRFALTILNGKIVQNRGFSWPVSGKVTTTFHDSNYSFERQLGEHTGIDVEVSQGTQISSANEGSVVDVGTVYYPGSTVGYTYVLIGHANGHSTLYGHLSSVSVKVGDFIQKGQVIGLSGGAVGVAGSGPYTNGPHLHFEVRANDQPIDPLSVLPQQVAAAKGVVGFFQSFFE